MTTHKSDSDPQGSTNNESHSRREDASGPDRSSRDGRRSRHRGHRARKERVLHTRISEQLAEDIREFAEDLRVPASNLVRNVLEEVFTVVNSVSGDVGGLMDDLVDEAEGVRDRVRRQARAQRRGARSHNRSSKRSRRDHSDVEEELRQDEERESKHSSQSETHEREGSEPGAGAEEEKKSAAELFPNILGWQPLVLNRKFECGRCQRVLGAGESAFIGLGGTGLTETALCGRCASSRTRGRG